MLKFTLLMDEINNPYIQKMWLGTIVFKNN